MNYEFNNENFNILMDEFVKLKTSVKREKIIEDLKFLIAFQQNLSAITRKNVDILYNKEIGDLNSKEITEKDFLEAIYAYLYILKHSCYLSVNSLCSKIIELNN